MRGRNNSPRPSSSAETSIDEDTADQLLADDFILPPNPTTSRTSPFATRRPTTASSPYNSPWRGSVISTPSISSSRVQDLFPSVHVGRSRDSQFSMASSTDYLDSTSPSIVFPT